MTATQTPVGPGSGELPAPTGLTFWFESPTQDEVAARLRALDEAKHTGHLVRDRFCALCREQSACPTCGGCGIVDDGDRLCPECNGRRA